MCLGNVGQEEWCTRVRLCGLLMLIDFAVRNHLPRGFSISADLADGYISKIGRPRLIGTIKEPLAVLCRIGILKRVREAVNGWHLKTSAAYALDGVYAKQHITVKVDLPACLAKKHASAFDRCEGRLNRRYPFRARLLADLAKLTFGSESRRRIVELSRDPDFGPSAKRAVNAVDGVEHKVRVSPRGQVTTSLTGCPREMKPFLLLVGKPVAFCDISHAHHCFLPTLLVDRY